MTFQDKLNDKKVLVSDGAWGTELVKEGFETGTCPELLNIDNPAIVRKVASSYVAAGSDIILTNTFGGSSYKLAKYGLGDRVEELNREGVLISKKAADGRALVFATIGPSGEFLAPLGLIGEDEMTSEFAEQVKAFVDGGADGILIESMTDLNETLSALKAAKDNSDLPVICSMTFDKGPKGFATMMGIRPENAVQSLEKASADAVGSNCGWGIDEIIEVANIMRPKTGLPLWFKPNAGMPELVDGKTVYRHTPEFMGERSSELIKAGASIIGGCCGTTPDHIRKMRETADRAS